MSTFADSVLEFLGRNGAISKCLVVGVSGGVDSIALLNILSGFKNNQLVCGHVDHGIREESAQDAAFVAAQCQRLGVFFESIRLSPPKSGLEAWGREERYKFFADLQRRHSAAWVVTAHTADDQIETVLMRVFQGREPVGITAVDEKRRLLRPLVSTHKADLIAYCKSNNLSWREDSSNADNNFLRNKIRNEIVPGLLAAGGHRGDLLALANSLSAEVNILREHASAVSAQLPGDFGSKSWLRALTALLMGISPEHQWRLVESVFLPELGYRLGQERGKLVVDFIVEGRAGIQVPGAEIRRKEGGILLTRS